MWRVLPGPAGGFLAGWDRFQDLGLVADGDRFVGLWPRRDDEDRCRSVRSGGIHYGYRKMLSR